MSFFKVILVIGFALLSPWSITHASNNVDTLLNLLQKEADNKIDSLALANDFIAASDYYYDLEYFNQSLEFAQAALGIYQQFDKLSTAETYGTVSLLYDCLGDYPKGVEASHNALDLFIELEDTAGIASSYNDIAVFLYYSGEYASALGYLKDARGYYEAIGDQYGVSMFYNNSANIYFDQGELQLALDYYYSAYRLDSTAQDLEGMSITLSNIGETYTALGEYEKADSTLLLSLAIARNEDDLWGMTNPLRGLADLYRVQGDLDAAIAFVTQSKELADSIQAISELSEAHRMLASLYEETGDHENALSNFIAYKELEDSIFNETNAKILHEFETKFQTNQKQKEIELLKKDSEITQLKHDEEILAQRNRMIFLIIGLIAAAIIGIVAYVSFINKKKANKLLQSQNSIIQDQKNKLEHTYQELEEKNNSIIDSIHYAKLIQHALLKSEEQQTMHLPAHFVLFLPKDIVSGDFYWALEKDNHFYFAVGDCTGHGVPGAFLTMLGISFLNDICNTATSVLSPAQILDTLRAKVISELSQDGQSESSKDGMDISLAKLDLTTKELEWAGANNPLWVVRNPGVEFPMTGENNGRFSVINEDKYQLLEVKPDKEPIGYSYQLSPFTNQKMQLQQNDMVYLFSDGYADQFGGTKGKKYKYKPFKRLLGKLSDLTMEEQKAEATHEFETWRGEHEQLDDVCILGIRV
jgi:serine phosphatase RsbU (regulator of sigma subunit)